MNEATLTTALEPVVQGIATLASQNATFQAHLRMLLGSFIDMLDNHNAVEVPPTSNTIPPDVAIVDGNVSMVSDDAAALAAPRATDFDFPQLENIEARCRLKAKAAAWFVTRQHMISEGVCYRDEIAPQDHKLIAEAKSLECFLWTSHPSYSPPPLLALLTDLSRHYEIMADAISLVRCLICGKHARMFRDALGLLALTNRMLWVAVEMAGGARDIDQQAVYHFLKTFTNEHRIYVSEMCNGSPLPELQDISEHLQFLKNIVQEVITLDNKRHSRFQTAEYHADLIASSRSSATDWKRLIEAIDALLADGVPPSNVRIREMLLPLVENLPPTVTFSPRFQRVLGEINNFLEGRDFDEIEDSPKSTAIVDAAARMLRGRTIVLIGGERRPDSQKRLQEQLQLNEVLWIDTRHGDSYKSFESYIAREDVVVVLLAIRWASHSFGEAERLCQKHGKFFVRLAGGYNPNQVANQIIEQCSDRLQASAG